MNPIIFDYLPILIFIGVAIVVSAALMGSSFFIAKSNPDTEKLSTYECGFEPFESARVKFDIRFYLVAILFIIFDLEVAFFISLGYYTWKHWCIWLFLHDDIFICSYDRIYIRMEKGCVRMGLV
jgi:NADH-quinone oxidoreductase subunit A